MLTGAFGQVSGNTALATAEPGEPPHGDGPDGTIAGCCANPANHSVWFAWTAPATAPVSFSTAGSDYDTVLSAYTGSGYGSLSLVDGNDDCHTGTGGTSCIDFDAAQGTTYYLAVDWAHDQGAPGTYALRWLQNTANDTLATATVLEPGATRIVGNNTNATTAPSDPAVAGQPGGASVWYRWQPPAGTVTVGTGPACTAPYDLLLGVYTLGADGSLSSVAQIAIPRGQQLTAAFVADGTSNYVILVEGATANGTTVVRAAGDVLADTAGGDLGLSQSTSVATAHPGQPLAYTVSILNAGPGPALGTTLTDTLPAATSLVSAPGCTAAGATLTCPLGRIDAGQAVSLTVRVLVAATAAPGAAIVNNASVSSINDPYPANNSSTGSVPTEAAADVAVTSSAPAHAYVGGTLSYTLTVANNGPNAAQNVRLDGAPLGPLAVGAQVTVPVAISLSASMAGTAVTRTATVTTDTYDPNAANNSVSTTTSIDAAADLEVSQSATASALAGGAVTYTFTVTNHGPSAAEGVRLTDQLPSDLVSAYVTGTGCNATSGVVTCDLGTLAPGASSVVAIGATVSMQVVGTSLANSATVSDTTHDSVTSNNTATAVIAVTPLGCPTAGSVHASQSWKTVRLELDGVCDTGSLRRARLSVVLDGRLRQADVKQVAIVGPTDAVVTGLVDGKVVTVTLHQGSATGDDTVRVQYGGYDSGTLSTTHGDVRIRRD